MIHPNYDYARIQDPENKIPPNEPVFLLRGQDETAADTLRFWVRRQRKLLIRDRSTMKFGDFAARQKAMAMATAHAFKMEDWKPQKAATM